MTNDIREWMTVEEAAHVLQLGSRMVNRYGLPPYNKLRTLRKGRRVLYHRDDVQSLAEELTAVRLPDPKPPKAELATRELESRITELQQALYAASNEIGRLNGVLEQQRLLTDDANALRNRVAQLEAERARYEAIENERDFLRQQLQERIHIPQTTQPQEEQPKPKKKGWWPF